MSKKTLIILLAIVIIGVLVIVIAGQRSEYTDEPVVPVDDTDTIIEDIDLFPVEDDTMIPEVPITEEELEEEVMEEGLLE